VGKAVGELVGKRVGLIVAPKECTVTSVGDPVLLKSIPNADSI
jgi:hypothetical protein